MRLSEDILAEPEEQKSGAGTWMAWGLVVGCVVLAVVSLQVFGRMRAAKTVVKDTQDKPVVTVTVAKASYATLPDVIVASGSVTAVDPLALGSEINGLRVEQVLVEEGDRVRRGQPLAVLNQALLRAQLAQAQARYRSSQAQVDRARQPNRSQDIEGLKAALAQAEANVTQERANLEQARATQRNAEATAQRYSKVLDEGFVTLQESGDRQTEAQRTRLLVVAAERRVQAAQFGVDQARQRLLLAEAGGRAEDVEIAQAATQEVAASIAQIEAQLDQTVIRAPEDGLILKRDVHLGEISSSAKPMFFLARRGELELKAEVPQADLLKLREGMTARIHFADRDTTGKLWQVSPQVEATSRLGYARIRLDGEGLKPGMFAEARLEVGNHRTLTIPAEAVQGEGGDYFVFRLDGTRAVRANIRAGVRTNHRLEVLEGLREGEAVAVTGTRFLADGDKVAVQP